MPMTMEAQVMILYAVTNGFIGRRCHGQSARVVRRDSTSTWRRSSCRSCRQDQDGKETFRQRPRQNSKRGIEQYKKSVA